MTVESRSRSVNRPSFLEEVCPFGAAAAGESRSTLSLPAQLIVCVVSLINDSSFKYSSDTCVGGIVVKMILLSHF